MEITLKVQWQCGYYGGTHYQTFDIEEENFIENFIDWYSSDDFEEWFELFLINQRLTEDFADYLNLDIEEPTEEDILKEIYSWDTFKDFLFNHQVLTDEIRDYIEDDNKFFNDTWGYLIG